MESIFNICPRVLKAMSLFASTDEERCNLAGICFSWSDSGEMDITGTDGRSLGNWRHAPHDEDLVREPGAVIVPIRAFMPLLNEAARKANMEEKNTVEVRIGQGPVRMAAMLAGDIEMVMRAVPIDAVFPSWQKVIPSEDKFKPIKKIGVNPALVKRFRDAARLIAPSFADGEAVVGLRFTGEQDTIEVKIGGAMESFLGYLMPAMLFGEWVPAKKDGEAA